MTTSSTGSLRPTFTATNSFQFSEPLFSSSSTVTTISRGMTTTTTTTNSNTKSSTTSPCFVGTTPTPFDDGTSPYQITTPIYYVNDKPHIGHAYTSLACDVLARYMRLSGRDVFFLSGTDEHGQKVEESAGKKGIPPQQFADEVSAQFSSLLDLLNISNDKFIRTTDEEHKKSVQRFWNKLIENDAIYLGSYEGWYSVRDECYYAESELIDGKAPTGSDVEWMAKEPSYFFKLSEYEDRLMKLYEQCPDFVAPASRRNEVLGFVKGGLRDLSISRTGFGWGVPVPGDDDHVMYVWIDALANYISALGYGSEKEEDFDKYWPAGLHVVGKDILRFHAIYWPAFLMAAGIDVPKRLFAHGWWTKDGEKISKSLGNVIDPVELVEKYGTDQTRFFLMAEVTFGNDGDFSHEKMVAKVNNNLSNEFGNLCQRTLSMVFKNCNGAVPANVGPFAAEDEALLSTMANLRSKSSQHVSTQAIEKYVDVMVNAVREANRYVDEMAPWALKKTDTKRMETVLYTLMEALRVVSILYQPIVPQSSNAMLDQLCVPKDERDFRCVEPLGEYKIVQGRTIEKPTGVFPRLELAEEDASMTSVSS
eukprot:CAMPEP_0184870364 /NCGR_PEP_ID=MMETSP0580-20130426/37213_1 /TAXON_ID=1118495 /ORGANISM="Dactyliosolen fragilissimus" /LENGTH=591 /DNA_ID=CAMNT_0027372401 /DNA_START=247 /DNA_END=2022 /DNA_ORIENTATION=+